MSFLWGNKQEPIHPQGEHVAIVRAAMGRPFQLGMLYDCRTDTLVTGLSLWDHETVSTLRIHRERLQHSSAHLITEDSLEDKAKHMGVSGDGKLGVMTGLIDVSGAAEYLKDNRSSEKQLRVTLHYQSISEFQGVDVELTQLKDARAKAVRMNMATHVVTGILYGADGVFVFDHMIDESSSKDVLKIKGDMESAIKQVQLNVTGTLDRTATQSSIRDKMSCKFYGDVILKQLPTNFNEARASFQTLIQLIDIGGDNEKVVPKKVWLLPLNAFDNEVPAIARSISNVMVVNVEEAVDEFHHFKITLSDLKKAYNFPPLSDHIQHQFDQALSFLDIRLNEFTTQVKDLLPQIRSGTSDERELLNLINNARAPPIDSLNAWLKDKEREAAALKGLLSCLNNQEGIEIASTPAQYCEIVIHNSWNYLLVVEFLLPSPGMIDFLTEIAKEVECESFKWYRITEKILQQRHLVKSFVDFARINYAKGNNRVKFAVTFVQGKETSPNEPIDIKIYKMDGAVEHAVLPSKPSRINVSTLAIEAEVDSESTHTGIVVSWMEPKHGQVKTYTITVTKSNDKSGTPLTTIISEPWSTKHIFPDLVLVPNQKYTISVQANFVASSVDEEEIDDEEYLKKVECHIIGYSEKAVATYSGFE